MAGHFKGLACLSVFITTALTASSYGLDDQASPYYRAVECPQEYIQLPFIECGQLFQPHKGNNLSPLPVWIFRAVGIKATNQPKAEPLVMITGGPGAGFNLENSYSRDIWLNIWRESTRTVPRDAILLGQRGTEDDGAEIFECHEAGDNHQSLGAALIKEDARPVAREEKIRKIKKCLARFGQLNIDKSLYTTKSMAQDLRDLRLALNINKWALYGVSFGARLAVATMRADPNAISAMILDSPDVAGAETDGYYAQNFMRALKAVEIYCHKKRDCRARVKNFHGRVKQISDDLAANPPTVRVHDIEEDREYWVTVTPNLFQASIFSSLYIRELTAILPEILASRPGRKRNEFLGNLLTNTIVNSSGVNSLTHRLVRCHDLPWHVLKPRLDIQFKQYPEISHFISWESSLTKEFCTRLYPPKEFSHLTTATTAGIPASIPTLVLNGAFDPIIPPSAGAELVRKAGMAYHIIYPATGHGLAATLPCSRADIDRFLTEPSRFNGKTRCRKREQQLKFWWSLKFAG